MEGTELGRAVPFQRHLIPIPTPQHPFIRYFGGWDLNQVLKEQNQLGKLGNGWEIRSAGLKSVPWQSLKEAGPGGTGSFRCDPGQERGWVLRKRTATNIQGEGEGEREREKKYLDPIILPSSVSNQGPEFDSQY